MKRDPNAIHTPIQKKKMNKKLNIAVTRDDPVVKNITTGSSRKCFGYGFNLQNEPNLELGNITLRKTFGFQKELKNLKLKHKKITNLKT